MTDQRSELSSWAKTRAYWRFWGPVAIVGVVLIAAAIRQGGAAWLSAAAVIAVEIAAMWLAWVVDDEDRTARVRAWIEGRQR